ncbi:MAG: hypothetical protein JSV78_13530 [Phycisphaerales bacterium]|nr:MAG: hypothetical protein JSV78_13530 [Phycisphaerales bacterium]
MSAYHGPRRATANNTVVIAAINDPITGTQLNRKAGRPNKTGYFTPITTG